MANTLRFVTPLEPQTEARLKQIQRTSLVFRTRQRAHAILLSAKGYRIVQRRFEPFTGVRFRF